MTMQILSDWPYLLFVAAVLLLEGLFSGSEMALISADRLALKKQAAAGRRGAQLALRLLAAPEQMLATVLVGTNLCVFLLGAVTTMHAGSRYGAESHMFFAILLPLVVLIFGELIPKTLFQRFSSQLAPLVSFPVAAARLLFSPLIVVLGLYGRWLSRAIAPVEELLTGRHRGTNRENLAYLLAGGKKETSLPSFESRIIRRILNFSRAQAKNALIPLVDVDAIADNLTVGDALEAFARMRHSRLPVYQGRVDNIVGIVHVFEIFFEKDLSKPVTEFMQAPSYFPETQKVEDILFTMQEQGIQMGVVVDEYGGAVGILTLEDLVEEIVGDISDEYDAESPLYRQTGEGEYLIQGRMEIDAINEKLKLGLPSGQYETLGGFLLQQFNRIPDEGDELYYGRFKFVVKQASDRVIRAVQVTVTG